MARNIQWVSLVNRNFTDIKQSILNRLSTVVPEVTDTSSSNIFIIIIDIMSGLVEKIYYYIDHVARETFTSTARLETSLYKKAIEAGYRVRSSIPASSVIQIDYVDSVGNISPVPTDIVINPGTSVTSSTGIPYITSDIAIIATGYPSAIVPVIQVTDVNNIAIGTTDGSNFQEIPLPVDYVDGTCSIIIGGDSFTLVDMFIELPTEAVSKSFVVEIIDGIPNIVFGDDHYAIKPDTGLSIIASYRTTLGSAGSVSQNTLTTIDTTSISGLGTGNLEVTNPTRSLRGLDIEGIEDLRRNIPLHIRTGNRAVTEQDFIDIAKMAPGVLKASGQYNCQLGAELFIAPRGGGIADDTLLASTKSYVDDRAVIGTYCTPRAAGETHIIVSATINGRYLQQASDIQSQVFEALVSTYNVVNSDINDQVHRSDIIALIDNQPSVDYLNLDYITIEPFLRPVDSNQIFDGSVRVVGGTSNASWTIIADNPITNTFKIYREGIFIGSITSGSSITYLGIIHVSIDVGFTAINSGDTWEFKTYPYNQDIQLTDNSIPVISESNINLTIVTN